MDSIKKYRLIIFLAIGFLMMCRQKAQNIYGLETSNCKIEKEIDGETHFYELSCDEWDVEIDYGYGVYSQNNTYTSEDYLDKEKWKMLVIPKLKFEGTTKVDMHKIMDSIEILSIDEFLNAKLRYAGRDFDYKISIPSDIANFVEEREVKGNVTKRLIYEKERMQTFKYFVVNNNNVNNGSPEAIAISLKSSRILDIEEVRNILSTVKLP